MAPTTAGTDPLPTAALIERRLRGAVVAAATLATAVLGTVGSSGSSPAGPAVPGLPLDGLVAAMSSIGGAASGGSAGPAALLVFGLAVVLATSRARLPRSWDLPGSLNQRPSFAPD